MGVLIALGCVVLLCLAIYWVFWKLWCWVVPAIWIGAPENIANPDYWLFVAAIFLLSFIGSLLFKSSK